MTQTLTAVEQWKAMVDDQNSKVKDTIELADMRTMIYGEKKVGKSSVASMFDKPFIINIEDGLKIIEPDLKKRGVPFRTITGGWPQVRKMTRMVGEVAKEMGYNTVILDGMGKADVLAQQWVMEVKGSGADDINTGDLGYGRGLRLAAAEMGAWIDDAYATGLGVVMIAHQMWKEPEGAPAGMFPEMSDRTWNYIKPKIDLVLRAAKRPGDGHVLIGRDTIHSETGVPQWFPDEVPMTYEALEAAFNNKPEEGTNDDQ